MVRYSREDALSERQFVLLYEAAEKLDEEKKIQSRFILMCAGRLGMRGGEIAHINKSWVNVYSNLIEIPKYDRCTHGKYDGEICGYCRNRAKDYLSTHNISKEEAMIEVEEEFGDSINMKAKEEIISKKLSDNLSLSDVEDEWWQPKTPAAVRSIPYDFQVRLQMTIERFFEMYDEFPISKSSLNRRVEKLVDISEVEKRVYPHSLRATAATTHASRNVSPYALMSIMGWRDMETARTYISASDESAAIEVRSKHR